MLELREARLCFTMECALEEVRRAANRVSEFLQEAGTPAGFALDCEMALVEACNNAVIHAKGDLRSITLQVTTRASAVEVSISDHTPGFQWPRNVRLPDCLAEHGRGLYLIRRLMDEVEYRPGPNGNQLYLRKYVPA